jgi:CRISPR-associated protein Csh2
MSTISQRSELLFLYDCKNCNPNGDPNNGNQPRLHEATRTCLVTDVRLKRTIRDFLMEKGYDGQTDADRDIFIRDENGAPVTGAKRSESYENKEEFTRKFIDVRLFGGVSAPKGKKKEATFNLTGPVQFGMGTSLHPVEMNYIKGTGAFATTEEAQQKTFREEYNITYGLIGFHGVINEAAARHTGLTDTDVQELTNAMWAGTKGLLSRSKKGHMPRLLVKVDYNEPLFFIGDLLEQLTFVDRENIDFKEITDVADYVLDVSKLNEVLRAHADKIAKVTITKDDRLQLSEDIFTK